MSISLLKVHKCKIISLKKTLFWTSCRFLKHRTGLQVWSFHIQQVTVVQHASCKISSRNFLQSKVFLIYSPGGHSAVWNPSMGDRNTTIRGREDFESVQCLWQVVLAQKISEEIPESAYNPKQVFVPSAVSDTYGMRGTELVGCMTSGAAAGCQVV